MRQVNRLAAALALGGLLVAVLPVLPVYASGPVKIHAGTVTAESDGPGKGACFTVTLPS